MLRKIEEISMNAWPALKTNLYDGWVLRFSNGFTKRANSINPIYSSEEDINLKIENVEKKYQAKNLKTIFKITNNVFPKNLDDILSERGYKVDSLTIVQTLDISNIEKPNIDSVICFPEVNDIWLDNYISFNYSSQVDKDTLVKILNNIISETLFVLLKLDNEIIACGIGVIEDNYVGLFDIVVSKDYRNKGYGKQLMLNILNLAKARNVSNAYLQVVADNTKALKLYEKLGFTEMYRYWYRIKNTENKINYNDISKIYDDVREEEEIVLKSFLNETNLNVNSTICDIGCGTGNYTNIIQKITKSSVYGLDSSSGMLEKAKAKNENITFLQGDAISTPFNDEMFDFIYLTDVIHHIHDINKLFSEFYRILKKKGKVCVVTQSHRQIEKRYMTEFFPQTAIVDKNRYPKIEEIINNAKDNNFTFIKESRVSEGIDIVLDNHFLELIEKKGYSMLHLINDEEYKKGLDNIKDYLKNGSIKRKTAGGTLVWFIKE